MSNQGGRVVLLVRGGEYGEITGKDGDKITVAWCDSEPTEESISDLQGAGYAAKPAIRIIKQDGIRTYMVVYPDGIDVYAYGRMTPRIPPSHRVWK